MRLTSRMPTMPSSPGIGEERHMDSEPDRATAPGPGSAAGTGRDTGTLGRIDHTAAAQHTHSTAATILIQKNVVWSRIRPPATAPANEPRLVETCRYANRRARRNGDSMLTP